MKDKFVSIRLDPQSSEKLDLISRKVIRSRGLTLRYLIEVGYRLLLDNPAYFFNPFGNGKIQGGTDGEN